MVGLDVEKKEVLPVQGRWQIIDCYKEEGRETLVNVKLKYLGENTATSVWIRTSALDNDGTTWWESQFLPDFSEGETQTFTNSLGTIAYKLNIEIHWKISGNSTSLSAEYDVVPL
jgi:hypothetical protein